MITKLNEKQILILRSQNHSYQKIHDKLGFSVDTIMKICKKGKNNNIENENIQVELSDSMDSIDKIRKIYSDIDDLINSGKLNAREFKKWEKRLKGIREIRRIDVDERIDEEKIKVIRKKDEEFNREIENNYIKKTIVNELENTLKEKDIIIETQRSEIKVNHEKLIEKENKISQLRFSKDCEIKKQKDQISKINEENKILYTEKLRLHRYIDEKQDSFNDKNRAFNNEKNNFFIHIEKEETNLIKSISELQEKTKLIKIREKKLEKQSEEIKQREDELYKTKEILNEDMRKHIINGKEEYDKILMQWNMIKKTEEQQKIEGQRLRKWQINLEKNGFLNYFSLPCPHCKRPKFFDASDPKINQKIKSLFGDCMHVECRLKNELPKRVTLHPVSYSGEPVFQSGFSPYYHS